MENEMNPEAVQTPNQAAVPTPAQVSNEPKIKLYDPGSYLLVGLFFTLLPVFIMSHINSKFLANGQEIKKRMRIYMWIYIVMMVANLLLVFWASYTVVQSSSVDAGALQTAKDILNQGGTILLVANIVLLILTIRFTNTYENPNYKALRAGGQADRKSGVLPSLIGIALTIFLYRFEATVLMYLAIKLV